jgi:hypothetical protein
VLAVPVCACFTMAFALQLRKKHGKTSVRVAEECQLAQWKQNIQNRTYITMRIHKHSNKKYTTNKTKQKHTNHTTINTMIKMDQKYIKECDKRKCHISSKLHMIFYLLIVLDTLLLRSSLHFTTLHPTTLHYTSPNYTSLHFTTLVDTPLPPI